MFRIALCDDDISFSKHLEELLKLNFHLRNLTIFVGIFVSGKTLIENLEKNGKVYDIIFLDIDMPELNGLLTADRLRQLDKDFILLFTTHMETEAPRGYHYNAFRFILKRRLEVDIGEAVATIVCKYSNINSDTIELKYKHKNSYDTLIVKEQDILYFELKKRRVSLKTINGDYNLLVYPLKVYKAWLKNSEKFYIVNRSYLINFDHVVDIDGDQISLTGNLFISSGYSISGKAALRKKYMLYIKERI